MTVYKTEIPRVGTRFELEVGTERIIVLAKYNGQREIYRRPTAEADSEQLMCLSDHKARQLGAILAGVYNDPEDLAETSVPLGEDHLDWYEVSPDAPVVDETVAEAGFSTTSETGATVIAIQRKGTTLTTNLAERTIQPGDILVTVGSRSEQTTVTGKTTGQ